MKGRDLGGAAGTALGTYLGGPVGGSIGSIAGSVLGGLFDSDDSAAAEAAHSRAMAEIEAVGAPPELAREILYKNYVQVGIEPELAERAVSLQAPKVAAIEEAPELRKAQMGALELLTQRAKTGLGVEDRAALAQIQSQQARETEAKRQQILQSYQQRGLGGAGAELASQLQAASAGAAQAGEEGLKLQAQAQQAALEAASRAGTLGGDIRRQEFDIAKTKAGALDEAAMARFNEAVARQRRNIESERERQQRSLGTAQRLSEANISRSQQESLRQRQAQEEDWYNKLKYRQLRAGMYTGQAQREEEKSARESAQSAQMGRGLSQLASLIPQKAPSLISSGDVAKAPRTSEGITPLNIDERGWTTS